MHPKLVNLKDFRWIMNTYVCSLYVVLRIHILILLHVNKNLMKSLEWISFIYMTHHENQRSHADTDKNINPHLLSSIISFFVFIHTYICILSPSSNSFMKYPPATTHWLYLTSCTCLCTHDLIYRRSTPHITSVSPKFPPIYLHSNKRCWN
jgi:hypothetical protein